MSYVEQLPSKKYRGVYRDSAGRKLYTPATARKQDARDAAQEAEVKAKRTAAAQSGTLSARTTWSQWADIWWASRNIETETERTDTFIRVRVLEPEWGNVKLNAITHAKVQAWVNRMLKVHATATVRRYFAVFRASLNAALEEEVLTACPCARVRLPKVPKTTRRHIEQDCLDALLPHLRVDYRQAIEFLSETGLRPGELCGLHWHNAGSQWLTVADVVVDGSKRIKAHPKDDDQRDVVLTTRALKILDELRETRPERTGCGLPHSDGKPCRSDLVFRQGSNGRPMTVKGLWRAIRSALAKAGLPPETTYSLRHLFGSRLAEAGVDVFELSRQMGHADVNQSTTYVHRTAAARDRVLAALGDPAAAGLRLVNDSKKGVGRGAKRGAKPGNQASRLATSEEGGRTA